MRTRFQVVFTMRNVVTNERWERSSVEDSAHWWFALIDAKKTMESALRRTRQKTLHEVVGVYVQEL